MRIGKIKKEGASSTWGFEILIGSGKRIFFLDRYIPSTKATATASVALIENITLQVQKEYPKAELVLTSQVLETAPY